MGLRTAPGSEGGSDREASVHEPHSERRSHSCASCAAFWQDPLSWVSAVDVMDGVGKTSQA